MATTIVAWISDTVGADPVNEEVSAAMHFAPNLNQM